MPHVMGRWEGNFDIRHGNDLEEDVRHFFVAMNLSVIKLLTHENYTAIYPLHWVILLEIARFEINRFDNVWENPASHALRSLLAVPATCYSCWWWWDPMPQFPGSGNPFCWDWLEQTNELKSGCEALELSRLEMGLRGSSRLHCWKRVEDVKWTVEWLHQAAIFQWGTNVTMKYEVPLGAVSKSKLLAAIVLNCLWVIKEIIWRC